MQELVRIDVHFTGTSTRVAILGEIDYETVDQIESRLASARDEHLLSHLIVDLSGTTFLDSAAMRLLVEAWRDARENGYRLSIVRAPEPVHRPMEIAGLQRFLPFVHSADRSSP